MKTDKIKNAEQFLDTYLGGNRNVSTLTWAHWIECLAEYADKHALKMIEKDRERVRKSIADYEMYIDERGLDGIYNDTPINLD